MPLNQNNRNTGSSVEDNNYDQEDVSESLRDMEIPVGERALHRDSLRQERRNSAASLRNLNARNSTTTTPTTTKNTPQNVYDVEDADIVDEERKYNNTQCCFLGCCCNFRVAVIIVDILLILYSSVMWIPLVVSNNSIMQQLSMDVDEMDDDYVVEILDEHSKVYAIINGVGALAYTLPLYGAWVYEIPHVLAGAAWLFATLLANITISIVYNHYVNNEYEVTHFSLPWRNWIVMAFLTALCMYPHLGLALALQRGTISKQDDDDTCRKCCGGPK